MPIDYSLYLITDSKLCAPRNMLDVVAQAVASGVTCVQLREKYEKNEKHADKTRIFEPGQALLKILRPLRIPLIINDHVEIAKLLDADGVHIGQNDMPLQQVRQLLGYNKIIGLSIENIAQAETAVASAVDADYFGVGPIFTTSTKPDAAPALGLQKLKSIRQIMHTAPLVAIGGINHDNVVDVLDCGVDGVAVVSAIMAAHDPSLATRRLVEIISSGKQQ